jgi:hypothetical protein
MANDLESLTIRLQRRLEPFLPDGDASVMRELILHINKAIRRAQEFYNFPGMALTWQVNTVTGVRALTGFPTLWKTSRGYPLLLDNTTSSFRELRWIKGDIDARRLYGNSTTIDQGAPRHILLTEGFTGAEVYPYPDGRSDYGDGQYRLYIPYYGYLADLTAKGDTNFFTQGLGEQYTLDAAFGYSLELIPGQEGHARQFRLSDAPLSRPVTIADRELRSTIRALKLRQVRRPTILYPNRYPLASSEDYPYDT